MKVVALVQARVGSTRLPGKVLAQVDGFPMIRHVMRRAQAIRGVDDVVLCTRTEPENDVLVALAAERAWSCWRGGEALGRLTMAAEAYCADVVVRLTGDCPLLDPALAETTLAAYLSSGADLVANTPGWLDGLDVEVMSIEALRAANVGANDPADREHVTPWLRRRGRLLLTPPNASALQLLGHLGPKQRKWSVDTAEELDLVRRVMPKLGEERSGYAWRATVAAMTKLEDAER